MSGVQAPGAYEGAANVIAAGMLLLEFGMLRQALVRDQVRLYMAQSALISVLAIVIAADRNLPDLYALAALSAALKVVAVPLMLRRLLGRTGADGGRVVLLERLVGGGSLGTEQPAEDLDLGLPHGGLDVVHGLVVLGVGQATAGDGGPERIQDDTIVADGRARHVQAGDGGTHANVSSAMAGEHVMPRPPGPVTRTTPGWICDRW